MNVLVTGGTGFVGREIVRQLRFSGHRVHLLARDPESESAQEVAIQYSAKIRPGNVIVGDSLRGVCAGMDAVIHLVGIISEYGDQTFDHVHGRGTQNMIFAAQDGNVQRFIHMSALGTGPNARSRYHQSKWVGEDRVRKSSLAWTVFRPSIIYGPDDHFVNMLAKAMRVSPVIPVFGSGQMKLQPVAVKCVATAFVKALSENRSVGASYDLCGPERITFNDVLNQVALELDKRRLKVRVPVELARWPVALLEEIFPRFLHRAPPINRDQLLMLQQDNVGDPAPADELFGLKHTKFSEGIAKYVR
jgi:uncharacterized protein YbjT (DUF2867 family)